MLNKIKEALEQLDVGPVQYGRVRNAPDLWNYVVFARDKLSRSGTSKTDFNRYYKVALVHEDFIPEGMEIEALKKLEEIPGLKQANIDIEYDYMIKKNSDTVVEMAVITFTEVLKGYKI